MTITPVVWKAPFKINTTDAPGANAAATNEQSGSDIVALTGGRMLVAWNDSSTNFSGLEPPDSVGQILDPVGVLVGGETYLSGVFGDGAQTNVDLAALSNGGFVAVYQTQDFATFVTGENVSFQVFDSTGTFVSSRTNGNILGGPMGVFQLGEQRDPAIVAFADGSFMIAYEDDSAGGSDIRGVVIDSAGAEQPSFLIADVADDAVAPVIARLNNGNLVTVFQQNGPIRDIQFSIVTAAGATVNSGAAATAASDLGGPDVAVLTGGNYVVVWTDDDGDGAAFDSGIKAQRFLQDGTATGGVIDVNAPLAGIQDAASVVALADGGFFVAWSDGPSGDVRGQRFDAAGVKVGSETASTGPGTASDADLSLTGDGRILLSFTNNSAGNKDVYVTILDPRTSPVNGTAGADVLTTLVTASTVNGLGGDDVIISGAGNDTLDGGGNSDTVDWSLATGAITVTLNAAGSGVLTVAGTGTDTYFNFENMAGGSVGDVLAGNAGVNALTGSGGDDVLYGFSGNDTLRGGLGIDKLKGGADDDTIFGDGGDDIIEGQGGTNVMTGGAGNDTFYVEGVNDRVVEAVGGGTDLAYAFANFTLEASSEVERLIARAAGLTVAGNDLVNRLGAHGGGGTLSGGAGGDRLDGGAGIDTLNGDAGGDTVYGGGGGDALNGGGGDDKVYGEGGDDTLTPGLGFDQFTGGAGNDTFRFAVADFENRTTTGLYDTIYDYSRDAPGGNLDRIQLQGAAADYVFQTTSSAAYLRIVHVATVGTVYVTTAVTTDPAVLAAQVEYFA